MRAERMREIDVENDVEKARPSYVFGHVSPFIFSVPSSSQKPPPIKTKPPPIKTRADHHLLRRSRDPMTKSCHASRLEGLSASADAADAGRTCRRLSLHP